MNKKHREKGGESFSLFEKIELPKGDFLFDFILIIIII
jgi:hypothetical protein